MIFGNYNRSGRKRMAKLDWALICERAILEADTSNLSIISIIESVILPKVPPIDLAKKSPPMLIPHKFSVVQYWTRSNAKKPETFYVRTEMIAPDGWVYSSADGKVDLMEKTSMRLIGQVPGFAWRGLGRYGVKIKLSSDSKVWRPVVTLGFEVIVAPDERKSAESNSQEKN